MLYLKPSQNLCVEILANEAKLTIINLEINFNINNSFYNIEFDEHNINDFDNFMFDDDYW